MARHGMAWHGMAWHGRRQRFREMMNKKTKRRRCSSVGPWLPWLVGWLVGWVGGWFVRSFVRAAADTAHTAVVVVAAAKRRFYMGGCWERGAGISGDGHHFGVNTKKGRLPEDGENTTNVSNGVCKTKHSISAGKNEQSGR